MFALTLGWVQKVIFFFSESSHAAFKINWNETESTLQKYILPLCTPTTLDDARSKPFFFRRSSCCISNLREEV